MQAPVRRSYRDVVRGGTTENLHSKEAEAQATAKINKSSQKSSCVLSHVNEARTGLTCHVTEKVHNTTEQTAEAPAATPTELPNYSTQQSDQTKNGLPEQGFKLAKNPGDGCESSQQTSGETVTTVQESSPQQGCTSMGDNMIKKQNESHQIPQTHSADKYTNRSSSSCIQKDNVKAQAAQVPVVEETSTAASNNAANCPKTASADVGVNLRLQFELKVSLPEDTAIKTKKKSTLRALNHKQPNKNTRNVSLKKKMDGKKGQIEKEKQNPGSIPAVSPVRQVHSESRWHPFTVNQSCSHKVCCRHNPGRGLPPNVQKW